MLDIQEAPAPINFEVELGPLRDYEGQFPQNDPKFETAMPIIEREEWLAVLVRGFQSTLSENYIVAYFSELIKHEALAFETIESFVRNPEMLSSKECAVFLAFFNAARGASNQNHREFTLEQVPALILRGFGIGLTEDEPMTTDSFLKDIQGFIKEEELVAFPSIYKQNFNTILLSKALTYHERNSTNEPT